MWVVPSWSDVRSTPNGLFSATGEGNRSMQPLLHCSHDDFRTNQRKVSIHQMVKPSIVAFIGSVWNTQRSFACNWLWGFNHWRHGNGVCGVNWWWAKFSIDFWKWCCKPWRAATRCSWMADKGWSYGLCTRWWDPMAKGVHTSRSLKTSKFPSASKTKGAKARKHRR